MPSSHSTVIGRLKRRHRTSSSKANVVPRYRHTPSLSHAVVNHTHSSHAAIFSCRQFVVSLFRRVVSSFCRVIMSACRRVFMSAFRHVSVSACRRIGVYKFLFYVVLLARSEIIIPTQGSFLVTRDGAVGSGKCIESVVAWFGGGGDGRRSIFGKLKFLATRSA